MRLEPKKRTSSCLTLLVALHPVKHHRPASEFAGDRCSKLLQAPRATRAVQAIDLPECDARARRHVRRRGARSSRRRSQFSSRRENASEVIDRSVIEATMVIGRLAFTNAISAR